MKKLYKRVVLAVSMIAAGGVAHQGCISGVTNALGQVNPCGTILNCNPQFYNFIRGVPDPFCNLPPFCSANDDPVYGGLAGGNP